MIVVSLPVFFRGSRNYIQGSLIVSLAAEALKTRNIIQSAETATLFKVKFSKITDAAVGLILPGEDISDPDHVIGDASFRTQEGIVTVTFVEDPSATPPREDDRSSLINAYTLTDKLCGSCTYSITSSVDDLVASVVEVVKRMHADISENVYDIWFTGLSGAKFPIDTALISKSGKISVENVMHKGTPEQYQTLFRVKVTQDGHEKPSAFMLTFAYKTVPQG